MTSLESGPNPPRVSDAERERALEVLREGAVQGRISQDTFVRRTDAVLHAQWQDDLEAVLRDLPGRRPRGGRLTGFVGRLAAFPRTLRRAWQAERLPELLLPLQPQPLSIGRAPGSMLRLTHFTVSRTHAQLRTTSRGDWSLRDLGSSNGTWVNGSRLTGSVSVRPGDQVRFGQVAFRLALPRQRGGQPPGALSPAHGPGPYTGGATPPLRHPHRPDPPPGAPPQPPGPPAEPPPRA
ncbi:DUF1707 and FHA domain-containing protein [Streptomyces sp. HNM0574]|uniref:DUF1707 and FHA domain-containing protein n=1 Tax=Streptomyces sp. HNM0574 TaxID=2714954 RepID=UPI001469A74E|nr:DUF1707 and FHA domain-containing protein [Streptomyces sp. HNM0574]NLU65850.1 FHA domain-containing protein [Streptomyces sp. HNM0574]